MIRSSNGCGRLLTLSLRVGGLWFGVFLTWAVLGAAEVVKVLHPLEGTVMPQNMCSPKLLWRTNENSAGRWDAEFKVGESHWELEDIQPGYVPPQPRWEEIKRKAGTNIIELVLLGRAKGDPNLPIARASVHFRISSEAVRYPLFFREVNLPFSEAVKDPRKIRWRFGSIDQGKPPPVVLENMPVCGNCHSFSEKGQWLAMDVDYANSKASYIITRTGPVMKMATSDIITWDDFRREDGAQTFGLLSQISPDARYVLSTVKDRSVFVPRPDLAFSQLFFPLKGILAYYERDTRKFSSLPGADDPAYVQSNPTWSPDQKWVVFARNRAAELEKVRDNGSILLSPEECDEFLKRGKEFRYDLYRISFNEGKGGKPEPLRGASANGKSNFFPKYSPDGRWIVFCQASNYMLLQPDSELYIIPAEGGEARRLGCNLSRMNSWHSWTPDGHWLVFSSKAHSDYTQLYLTYVNEAGEASPPVWLSHLVDPGRAANIPEFVDLPENAITKIQEQFLDDYSFVRAGNAFFRGGDADGAITNYQKALVLNPQNAMAHQKLGFLMFNVKNQRAEALPHLEIAVQLEPHNGFAQFDLGMALLNKGESSNAIPHLAEAVRFLPNGYDRQYNVVDMNYHLALALYSQGRYSECFPRLEIVLKYSPNDARANFLMAMTKAWLGEIENTAGFYQRAVEADARMGQLPDYYDLLSRNLVQQGRYGEGFQEAEKGWKLALAAGRAEQAGRLKERMELCRARQ